MAPTLVLTIGFAIDGTPTCLYCGLNFTAAETAAATANAGGSPLVQIYRNPGPPFQEFRPVPV
jgi:hypothetical protein